MANLSRILRQCVQYYEQGHIKPIRPIRSFAASEIADAFRYMQKGTHIGKLTVRMPDDLKDLPCASRNPELPLHADASYFIVGGLGGLGRSVSSWLVQNGAKHLVFLSRSGRNEKNQYFLQEMEALGCKGQVFTGSVANIDDVKRVVAKAEKPIRGVLQLSMALKVSFHRRLHHICRNLTEFRTELLSI